MNADEKFLPIILSAFANFSVALQEDNINLDIKDVLSCLYRKMSSIGIIELSKNRIYPKTCFMYASILYKEANYELCNEVTKNALEALTLTGDLNFRADIIYLNALSKLEIEPENSCIDKFLDAYYVAEFFGQDVLAKKIEDKIREVYKWENIDEVPLLN